MTTTRTIDQEQGIRDGLHGGSRSEEEVVLPNDISQQDDDEKDSFLRSCIMLILKKLMSVSWIAPPAIILIIGGLVNFRLATTVAFAWCWISLVLGYFYHQGGKGKTNESSGDGTSTNDNRETREEHRHDRRHDYGTTSPSPATHQQSNDSTSSSSTTTSSSSTSSSVWPKTFDVVNPIAMTILLPVALKAGEDFCRLWMGVIILGIFTAICFGSVWVWNRPLMVDFIPLGEDDDDERLQPMMIDLRYYLTLALGVLFVIMFTSNLALALIGSEFGTTYVLLNFVVPYGSLAVGIPYMRHIGKHIWIKSAEKHHGKDWEQILFGPDSDKDDQSEHEATSKETSEQISGNV